MALLSTVTVDAAAAAAPRRRWLSFWSLGESAGGDEVVGVVVGVLNREGEREGREFLVLVREREQTERERDEVQNFL